MGGRTASPDGIAPLDWLLLTNVEVSNFSEALQRIHWYTQRWHIEIYFKVLKSGTKVEQTRLQTKDRLLRYIALLSVIAWRLYWMTLLKPARPRGRLHPSGDGKRVESPLRSDPQDPHFPQENTHRCPSRPLDCQTWRVLGA